jgi:hypothetical protein
MLRVENGQIHRTPDVGSIGANLHEHLGGLAFEGEVDPVLVPRLIGTLRFLLGQEHEYIDAPITSSDFNATNSILSLVAKHEQFGDLVMQLALRDRTLSGDWNAPSLGANGTIDLVKE